MDFRRKPLNHRPPDWVKDGAVFFVTLCLKDRNSEILNNPQVAEQIRTSTAYCQKQKFWWVQLTVLMPDHLHALVFSFNQAERSMSQCIQAWKRYLSRTTDVCWQQGYFDHRLRSEEALREKALYVRENPVRAGFVNDSKEWSYLWTAEDFDR